MAITNGARLGPYEVLAPIGTGGMGEVYRAKDMRLDRIVAIKVLQRFLLNRMLPDERSGALTVVAEWAAGLGQ